MRRSAGTCPPWRVYPLSMAFPPTNNRRRHPVRLAALLCLAGCAAPPAVTPRSAQVAAHVVLVNLTDQPWDIGLMPAEGGAACRMHLPPRATRELSVAGGDYAVTQTLLDARDEAKAVRRLAVSFSAGERYRWPLATVSPSGDGPSEPAGGPR